MLWPSNTVPHVVTPNHKIQGFGFMATSWLQLCSCYESSCKFLTGHPQRGWDQRPKNQWARRSDFREFTGHFYNILSLLSCFFLKKEAEGTILALQLWYKLELHKHLQALKMCILWFSSDMGIPSDAKGFYVSTLGWEAGYQKVQRGWSRVGSTALVCGHTGRWRCLTRVCYAAYSTSWKEGFQRLSLQKHETGLEGRWPSSDLNTAQCTNVQKCYTDMCAGMGKILLVKTERPSKRGEVRKKRTDERKRRRSRGWGRRGGQEEEKQQEDGEGKEKVPFHQVELTAGGPFILYRGLTYTVTLAKWPMRVHSLPSLDDSH